MLVARGYNFACVKKRSNCKTVPRLLSMIVDSLKTADISRRQHCFPREMTSEERAQKFHTDDESLHRTGYCF